VKETDRKLQASTNLKRTRPQFFCQAKKWFRMLLKNNNSGLYECDSERCLCLLFIC